MVPRLSSAFVGGQELSNERVPRRVTPSSKSTFNMFRHTILPLSSVPAWIRTRAWGGARQSAASTVMAKAPLSTNSGTDSQARDQMAAPRDSTPYLRIRCQSLQVAPARRRTNVQVSLPKTSRSRSSPRAAMVTAFGWAQRLVRRLCLLPDACDVAPSEARASLRTGSASDSSVPSSLTSAKRRRPLGDAAGGTSSALKVATPSMNFVLPHIRTVLPEWCDGRAVGESKHKYSMAALPRLTTAA
mmetsp:Transcript_21986/g.47334  ORF Transcript_21986/g.47334 Transcript_21986/m.47334 type:complete len:244 (-) Transcript_21986:614-1345(-)